MAKKPTGNRKSQLLIISLFVFAFLISSYVYTRVFKPIAVINGERITRDNYIKELEKQSGKRVLDGMITKTLIYQMAKDKKVTVTDTEVDEEIKKIEANLEKQQSNIEDVLAAQNMTRADLKERVKINKLSQKLVENKISITDEEVEQYIAANSAQFPQQPVSKAVKEEAKEQIRQQKMSEQIQIILANAKKRSQIEIYLR